MSYLELDSEMFYLFGVDRNFVVAPTPVVADSVVNESTDLLTIIKSDIFIYILKIQFV